MRNKVRIDYIDIAKAIGIFLVVIGHTLNQHGIICKCIRMFHMPLFFLLAGVVYNNKNYKDFNLLINKKIKSISFPLINFTIIWIILNYTLLPGLYNIDDFYNFFPGGMWFLFVLLIVEILFFFIVKIKLYIRLLLSCLCLFIACYINGIISLPYSLNTVFIGIFYYSLGYTFQTVLNKYYTLNKNKHILLFLLILIPIYVAYIYNDSLDLISNYIPTPNIIFILTSIIGIVSILSLSILISKSKSVNNFFCYLGRNTLIVLCTHSIFIFITYKFKSYIDNHWEFLLIQQCFVWFLCFFTIEFINKYIPFIIGKNRK